MKRKTKINVFLIIIITIIVLGCCYYILTVYQNQKYKEGLRTLPKPTRHTKRVEYVNQRPVRDIPPNNSLNNIIDWFVGKYFDENNLPYEETINMFENECIDNGIVSDENMRKMMDVCYYVLDIVLPNIPTINQPNPIRSWPKIQWISESWFPLDKAYSTQTISGNAWSYFQVDKHIINDSVNKAASNKQTGSVSQTPGSIQTSSPTNVTGGGGGGGSRERDSPSNCDGSATVGGDCRIQCPTSCMPQVPSDNTSRNDETPPPIDDSGNIDSTSFNWGSYLDNISNNFIAGYLSDSMHQNQQFSATYGSNPSHEIGYYITNKMQGSNLSTNLDQDITNWIQTYFTASGPDTNAPTKKALDLFDLYTRNQYPADDIHIQKLRNLVYYFMERIIPGMPTFDHPLTYVIWKPLSYT